MDGGEGGVLSGWTRGEVSGAGRFAAVVRDAWRARVERQPVPKPAAIPDARLPRSRWGAALAARLAVRNGVRLDDFLRYRLARYAARLAEPLEALPATVDVEDGEPVVRARARPGLSITAAHLARPAPPRDGVERWRARLAEREGPSAVRELADLEARLGVLEGLAADAQARIAAAVRTASEAAPAAGRVEATPEQLGRPPVPAAWPLHLLRGFSLALLASESSRLAGPVLGASGLDDNDVAAALARAPLAAGLAIVFAAGAAAAIFTFLGVAVRRLVDLASTPAPAPRRRLFFALAGGAAALAAVVAGAAGAPAPLGEPALLVAVPLAAVLLLRQVSSLAAARAEAVAAALEWDRERTRVLAVRAAHAEAIALADDGLRRIEAERAEVRRRARAIERRAVEADRLANAAAAAEARRLDRLAETLAAALELDRYAYLKVSAARSHAALARPVRPERPRLKPAVSTERLGVAG